MNDLWLVWIRGPRGPMAQLIPAPKDKLPYINESVRRSGVIEKIKVSREFYGEPLDELMKFYPCPVHGYMDAAS